MNDPKRSAPAAERNKEPILEVLRRVLPGSGRVFEVGSGTGQHALHFARAFPGLEFVPSDPDPSARASIEAWRRDDTLPNLLAPLAFDAEHDPWPTGPFTAILSINVVHISPWSVAESIFRNAASALSPTGILFLYGPYKKDGAHTAPSNEAFDESLRARDPRWGVRDMEAVRALGSVHGLDLREAVPMPANNFSLVFGRSDR